ncbi:hypothetical protein [Dactylosporangium sp. NPDC005555]|uniref:hypothetical protein n=1 Tax=Dactylosporangium sp. NPDC005555 TaxID=3154889 RepID=UPI0033B38F52
MDDVLPLGAGSVEQFLLRWYGPTGSSRVGAAAVSFAAPSELIEWHAAAERAGRPVTFQDHPIALGDLSPDPGGMLTFWVENQHVYYWAVNLSDPESRVFCREIGSEEWQFVGEDLGKFLLHCTVREAIIGAARKFTVFVAESSLNDALELFSVLDFAALVSEDPETRIWSSSDALASVTVPPVGYGSPDEQFWMITIAVAADTSVEKYGSRFGLDLSGEIDPPSYQ